MCYVLEKNPDRGSRELKKNPQRKEKIFLPESVECVCVCTVGDNKEKGTVIIIVIHGGY